MPEDSGQHGQRQAARHDLHSTLGFIETWSLWLDGGTQTCDRTARIHRIDRELTIALASRSFRGRLAVDESADAPISCNISPARHDKVVRRYTVDVYH